MPSPVSKTKQLQKETLEYGRVRIETSPFQKFIEKQAKAIGNQFVQKPRMNSRIDFGK